MARKPPKRDGLGSAPAAPIVRVRGVEQDRTALDEHVESTRQSPVAREETTPHQEAESTNELTIGGENANRRRSARVPLRVWAENRGWDEFCLWLAAEDIRHDFAFCYRTTDLSTDGIFLETTTPLDLGVEMDLTFKLPGSDRAVHATGEVVRVVKRGTRSAAGMAVRFCEMDAASRATLDAFLIARG